MLLRFCSILLFILLLLGCDQATPSTQPAQQPQKAQPLAGLFANYFDAEAQRVAGTIKYQFDMGLRDGFDGVDLGELYAFHTRTLRSDIMNEVPYASNFPYNGELKLAAFEKDLTALPFMTKKCGFQQPQTDEVVHFWCLSLDERFQDYLRELGKSSSFIAGFQEQYLEAKTITPAMRQELLFLSDEIDFANPDHQFVYALLHLITAAEQDAYATVTDLEH